MVDPRWEVGVISDWHQGILNAVREQMDGYPPSHHKWCTRHLAKNLLRKEGVKDNFELSRRLVDSWKTSFLKKS